MLSTTTVFKEAPCKAAASDRGTWVGIALMVAFKSPVGFEIAEVFCCVIAAGAGVVEIAPEVVNNELGSLDVVLPIVEVDGGPSNLSLIRPEVMGNSQSSSATQFAPVGVPALPSVKPCYLSGDPDLYGIGIRFGFYFQYAAAVIVIFGKFDKRFVGWLAGFVLLATATFVSLCINSTADTLVIMDWSIVADHEARERKWLNESYVQELIPRRDAVISRYQEAFVHAIGNIIYAVQLIMSDTRARQQSVKHLVERFVKAAQLYDSAVTEPSDHPAEGASHIPSDGGGQLRLLEPQIDTLARHIPEELEDLRRRVNEMGLETHHLEALARVFPDTQHTTTATEALAAVAREEQETNQLIKFAAVTTIYINKLGLVDRASAGVILITYAGFCSLAPWLFFIGVDRGARQGCDVKLLFFFAPISVYNHAFAICLKVIGVIAVILCLIAFVCGVIFLVLAVVQLFDDMAEEAAKEKGIQAMQATQRASDGRTTQPECNTMAVLAPRHGGHHLQVLLYGALYMQEESVEMTIQVNHLTLPPLFNSTGQLIALFVGGFMLFVTLYKELLSALYRFISWYNGGHWIPELRRVRKLGNWFHRFLRSMRLTQPAVGISDVERTTGGQAQILGNRIEEIGEGPLPLPAPNPV
ncbi:hypothetical protein VFPPC_06561 [Pochonia chlamydosporia 170]|uniref:Uncharacterized protein n=1 Tax=Pochonia chlamydosporia 170 TaxID=1380566 RepID=A0A179F4X7_METCM|nr:hypothetical protein VFPPC_06561 [Pochonia chlamydosporia 170]OAQ60420.2 hypothetical protein VFPPC_06561 [Pochonia chlamydosporia 170]